MPKIEKKKGPLQSQCFFVFFTYFICPPDDLQKKKKTEIQYLSIYLFTHGTNGKRISHVYKHWKSLDSLSETWVAAEANALDSLWRLANWLDLLDYLMNESKLSRWCSEVRYMYSSTYMPDINTPTCGSAYYSGSSFAVFTHELHLELWPGLALGQKMLTFVFTKHLWI